MNPNVACEDNDIHHFAHFFLKTIKGKKANYVSQMPVIFRKYFFVLNINDDIKYYANYEGNEKCYFMISSVLAYILASKRILNSDTSCI